MNSFVKDLLSLIRKRVVTSLLLGINVRVVRGTISGKTDYDDAWFFQLARNSKVIFDIGANVGYTALLAILTGNKQVLLADANPSALETAARNMVLNNMINECRFFNGFVADKEDESLKFYTVEGGAAGSMFKSHAKTAGKANNFFEVKTSTIDLLVKKYNMIPDLVKVDVEGAESLVLNGSFSLASLKQTRFFVEMHGSQELSMGDNAQRIIDWCNKVGFIPYYLKEKTTLSTPEQISHRGRCHLLLQPCEWTLPEYLIDIPQGASLPASL